MGLHGEESSGRKRAGKDYGGELEHGVSPGEWVSIGLLIYRFALGRQGRFIVPRSERAVRARNDESAKES
jgi:hypothetical protein